MPVTFDLLASVTVGSPTSSITFSGISQSYTDLYIATFSYSSGNQGASRLKFNNDSSTLYSTTYAYFDKPSAPASARQTNQAYIVVTRTTDVGTAGYIHIPQYKNTSYNKLVLSRSGSGNNITWGTAGVYRNTNAITSMTFVPEGGGNYSTGTTFSLYGILAAGG